MVGIRKNHDPLSCAMSLGDHLEELRARLILALLGLIVGAIVSLIFGKQILKFIEMPYNSTIRERLQKTELPRVESEVLLFVETFFANMDKRLSDGDPNAADIDPKHVAFLRDVTTQSVKDWTVKMRGATQDAALPFSVRLQTLAPAEAFTAYMKIGFIAGLILTCPWVFYQIWMFVAAGLYPNERHYVRTAVPFSAGLFIVGSLFFLFIIAPLSLKFFLSFGDVVGVSSNWTLQRYISFITILMLVFGIAFQTPIAIFILVRTGLVGLPTLRRVRKYALLVIFIVAAVATPPDVISQVSLAIPLYGLYELGMLLALFAEKKAKERQQQAT